MATRWPSSRDLGAHAQHRVGVRSLLCRHHGYKLEIPLHPSYRLFRRDHGLFDCGGMAFHEASLKPLVPKIALHQQSGGEFKSPLINGRQSIICLSGRGVEWVASYNLCPFAFFFSSQLHHQNLSRVFLTLTGITPRGSGALSAIQTISVGYNQHDDFSTRRDVGTTFQPEIKHSGSPSVLSGLFSGQAERNQLPIIFRRHPLRCFFSEATRHEEFNDLCHKSPHL